MTNSKRPRASSKEFDKINKIARRPLFYNQSSRATGRTFRMLIQAVLACSSAVEKKTIYVIGNDKNHCNYMHHLALNILSSVSGLDVVRDEICMPHGSRLLFRTKDWYDINANSRGLKVNRKDVFEDHYVMESRYGRK